jgi:hypothetical protein
VDRWVEQDAPAELERVRSDIRGGAFPHPPVLPVVAVVAVLFGISVGFGLAPRTPAATPRPTADLIAVPTGPATAVPTGPATAVPTDGSPSYTPPGEGTTLAVAVTAAEKTFGIKAQDVISARLANGTAYLPAIDGWVWEILVRGPGEIVCGRTWIVPAPQPSYSAEPIYCDEAADVVIVDYASGDAVIMASARYP